LVVDGALIYLLLKWFDPQNVQHALLVTFMFWIASAGILSYFWVKNAALTLMIRDDAAPLLLANELIGFSLPKPERWQNAELYLQSVMDGDEPDEVRQKASYYLGCYKTCHVNLSLAKFLAYDDMWSRALNILRQRRK
jgi:hypothetical protein